MLTNWKLHAACRGMDTELFYPEQGESPYPALAVCATCPVTPACLATALKNNERFGIWGGKSAKQRQNIRRDEFRRKAKAS